MFICDIQMIILICKAYRTLRLISMIWQAIGHGTPRPLGFEDEPDAWEGRLVVC